MAVGILTPVEGTNPTLWRDELGDIYEDAEGTIPAGSQDQLPFSEQLPDVTPGVWRTPSEVEMERDAAADMGETFRRFQSTDPFFQTLGATGRGMALRLEPELQARYMLGGMTPGFAEGMGTQQGTLGPAGSYREFIERRPARWNQSQWVSGLNALRNSKVLPTALDPNLWNNMSADEKRNQIMAHIDSLGQNDNLANSLNSLNSMDFETVMSFTEGLLGISALPPRMYETYKRSLWREFDRLEREIPDLTTNPARLVTYLSLSGFNLRGLGIPPGQQKFSSTPLVTGSYKEEPAPTPTESAASNLTIDGAKGEGEGEGAPPEIKENDPKTPAGKQAGTTFNQNVKSGAAHTPLIKEPISGKIPELDDADYTQYTPGAFTPVTKTVERTNWETGEIEPKEFTYGPGYQGATLSPSSAKRPVNIDFQADDTIAPLTAAEAAVPSASGVFGTDQNQVRRKYDPGFPTAPSGGPMGGPGAAGLTETELMGDPTLLQPGGYPRTGYDPSESPLTGVMGDPTLLTPYTSTGYDPTASPLTNVQQGPFTEFVEGPTYGEAPVGDVMGIEGAWMHTPISQTYPTQEVNIPTTPESGTFGFRGFGEAPAEAGAIESYPRGIRSRYPDVAAPPSSIEGFTSISPYHMYDEGTWSGRKEMPQPGSQWLDMSGNIRPEYDAPMPHQYNWEYNRLYGRIPASEYWFHANPGNR